MVEMDVEGDRFIDLVEFDAFHCVSIGEQDEDSSAVASEMGGRALAVWWEAHAVAGAKWMATGGDPFCTFSLLPSILHELYRCPVRDV
jgi:hypothetical protein